MKPQRALRVLLLLIALAVLAMAVAISCGSSGCAASTLPSAVLWDLRLPRVLSAFAVGALLALAGALMQLLLRNPLADPYVLGISGGAAVGAMGVMLFAPLLLVSAAFAPWLVQLGALVGALAAIGLLFSLTLSRQARVEIANQAATSSVRLILTGVMIAAGFGALLTLILSVAPDARLRGMIFWLMGDLEQGTLYLPAWCTLMLTLWWSLRQAPQLNLLAHGDVHAQLLGVPVKRLRPVALLIASLATAGAVAVAGTIGFVGLVVPHGLRLVLGNDQRLLLPAAALSGGIALTLADLIARSVIAPVQLPVGVITALIGVPVFLFLLRRAR